MKTKIPKIYRQGDVLLIETTKTTARGKDAREKGRIILAHGEVTGHCHEVESTPDVTFEDVGTGTAAKILRVMGRKPVMLRHQEHSPIEIDPGAYIARRQ